MNKIIFLFLFLLFFLSPDYLWAKRKINKAWKKRQLSSLEATESSSEEILYSIGPEILVGYLMAIPEGSLSNTTGLGLGVGLHVGRFLDSHWQLRGGVQYQKLGLSRTLSGSGAITDPNPLTISQSVSYFGLMAGMNYYFGRGNQVDWNDGTTTENYWVLWGGFEYLFPVSGLQTDTNGNSMEFTPTSKPFFLVVGPSYHFPLFDEWCLQVGLRGALNLASKSIGSFYSIRLNIALQINL